MNITRAAAIVLRQYYLYYKSLPRLLGLFVWIIVDIILWGFMTHYLDSMRAATFSFVPAILGAVLLWNFLIRTSHGLSVAFMEDGWSRNLLNIFASPLSVPEYVTGLAVSSILTSLMGLALMLFLATCVFGMSIFSYGLLIFPFLLILFLMGAALGILGSAIMLRYGPSAEWLVWPIPAFIAPFVGVFYPLETLPHWMQTVSHILPPSYVFENIRHIVAGESFSASGLWIGLSLAAGYFMLAYALFARTCRFAIRTGLISRYGAESVIG